MNTAATTKATPGYNTRISVYFTTSRKGQRAAWHFSWPQMRAFRMPLAEAELLVAQDLADVLDSNPMHN